MSANTLTLSWLGPAGAIAAAVVLLGGSFWFVLRRRRPAVWARLARRFDLEPFPVDPPGAVEDVLQPLALGVGAGGLDVRHALDGEVGGYRVALIEFAGYIHPRSPANAGQDEPSDAPRLPGPTPLPLNTTQTVMIIDRPSGASRLPEFMLAADSARSRTLGRAAPGEPVFANAYRLSGEVEQLPPRLDERLADLLPETNLTIECRRDWLACYPAGDRVPAGELHEFVHRCIAIADAIFLQANR